MDAMGFIEHPTLRIPTCPPQNPKVSKRRFLAPPLLRELSPALLEPNAPSGTNHQIPAVLIADGGRARADGVG